MSTIYQRKTFVHHIQITKNCIWYRKIYAITGMNCQRTLLQVKEVKHTISVNDFIFFDNQWLVEAHLGFSVNNNLIKHISLELDLHINTSRKIKLHQRIYCLGSRIQNINETLMGPYLEMEPSILMYMWRFKNTVNSLLSW